MNLNRSNTYTLDLLAVIVIGAFFVSGFVLLKPRSVVDWNARVHPYG